MAYILVVDDEGPVRSYLRRQLEKWGYRVEEAESATTALEMMMLEVPAIVLLDIRMPGHDGLWLAERIHQRWKGTAIVMVTGADDIETIEKAKRFGVIDYVSKPFGRELLRQALRRASDVVSHAVE